MRILLTISWIILHLAAGAQTREVRFHDLIKTGEKPLTVVIDNIYGDIRVKAGNKNAVTYEVKETLSARSDKGLETGLSELKMNVVLRQDSLIFYFTAPWICNRWNGCSTGSHIHRSNDNYDFRFDFDLEIPAPSGLYAATINEGKVEVTGVQGELWVSNINGDVEVKEAHSVLKASTINGDVNVHYSSAPAKDASFSTINGSIDLYSNADTQAYVTARSMHGSLFTDFDFSTTRPESTRVISEDGTTTTYKINETVAIRIGKEGPKLDFETLNGNIYLRKH